MRTIELTDQTYHRLVEQVQEFGETAEDVIVRLLDGQARRPTRPRTAPPLRRAAPGSILPESAYWKPLLTLLEEAGGEMPANDAIEEIGRRLQHAFSERDYEGLEQGEVRWRNRVRFARLRMKEKGLLSSTSRRGIWAITDAGRRYLHDS